MLEHDGKALIDLVDDLSLGSIVLVSVTNDNLADHDAHLDSGTVERFSGHDDQVQAIAPTLLIVIGVLLGTYLFVSELYFGLEAKHYFKIFKTIL
jgi:hypothetical protein